MRSTNFLKIGFFIIAGTPTLSVAEPVVELIPVSLYECPRNDCIASLPANDVAVIKMTPNYNYDFGLPLDSPVPQGFRSVASVLFYERLADGSLSRVPIHLPYDPKSVKVEGSKLFLQASPPVVGDNKIREGLLNLVMLASNPTADPITPVNSPSLLSSSGGGSSSGSTDSGRYVQFASVLVGNAGDNQSTAIGLKTEEQQSQALSGCSVIASDLNRDSLIRWSLLLALAGLVLFRSRRKIGDLESQSSRVN